jgi:hypothetical protein
MSIQAGDAVFVFRGDTTDLDAAFDRITQEAQRKLQSTTATIDRLGEGLVDSGQAASRAGELVSVAGEQMERANQRASEAFHATRNSIDLLSGEIGVSLPRELKNFVARMPAVQSALSGAFSATAVIALGVFVAEAAEKISKFVGDTFIFTKAMQANDAAFSKLNGEIAAQVQNLKQLHDAYDLVGLEGSAKLSAHIRQLNSDLEKDNAAVRQNRETILNLQEAYDKLASSKTAALLNAVPGSSIVASGFKEELDQAKAAIQLAQDTQRKVENDLKVHLQERTNLEKEGNQAITAEDRSAAEVRINSAASLARAENDLWLAQQQLRVATTTGSYAELGRLQAEFQQRQLDADVSHLNKLKGNLDPSKSGYAAAVQAFNNQIVVLEDENYVAREQAATEFKQRIDTILKVATGPDAGILKEIAPNPTLISNSTDAITGLVRQIDLLNEVVSPTANSVDQINEAFQTLGITSNSLNLAQQSLEQARAIDVLSKAAVDGTISFHDIAEAEIEYLSAQQASINASDLDTNSKKRQTAAIEAQIAIIQRKLDPALRAHSQLAQAVASATGQAILSEAYAFGQGEATITQAVRGIAAAMIQAVAQQAEIKGADAFAWGLWDLWHNPAAAATDFAASAAWFAVAGAASAAAGAVAGSGRGDQGQPAAPSNLPPIQQTAATTAQQNPVQTQNIQRFAGGGLVSQQTLAIIGDSRSGGVAREGVLPLDDPKAMAAIAAAISEHMAPQGPTVIENHYHNHIKGDVIDYAQLMRKISREEKRGAGRLHASEARRVLR